MEKFAHMAMLADFYGPLLTDKQKNALDLYYEHDLSLGEIAELESISRQAVHDLLKRTERILIGYEEKLGLLRRFWQEREKLVEVENLLADLKDEDLSSEKARKTLQAAKERLQEIYSVME